MCVITCTFNDHIRYVCNIYIEEYSKILSAFLVGKKYTYL